MFVFVIVLDVKLSIEKDLVLVLFFKVFFFLSVMVDISMFDLVVFVKVLCEWDIDSEDELVVKCIKVDYFIEVKNNVNF